MNRTIYLAGGCFWGTQKYLDQIDGVLETEVGFANGCTEHPSYEEVCHNNTGHAETVVLLSKGEVDSKKIRVEFSLEDMDMSGFQKGATYEQIKAYVLEHTGLKVSNLYISQIKRKCGIEVGKNYNLPKSEDSRQHQCPPEKEKAIREAFKYFGMI